MEQEMDSQEMKMVINYIIGYWTLIWSSLYGSLTIPTDLSFFIFLNYKTVTVKFLIAKYWSH
jgi:hypothetical protein